MFDTVGDDGDDAMLLLGQYYPDNSLITNLTLDIVATLFLVIGSFRSPNQNVNYRFVDPCQFSKLKISLIDDQNYTLYSNSTQIKIEVSISSNYSFCNKDWAL